MRVPLAGGRHRRDASVPDEGGRAAWVVALSDEASLPSYRHTVMEFFVLGRLNAALWVSTNLWGIGPSP